MTSVPSRWVQGREKPGVEEGRQVGLFKMTCTGALIMELSVVSDAGLDRSRRTSLL